MIHALDIPVNVGGSRSVYRCVLAYKNDRLLCKTKIWWILFFLMQNIRWTYSKEKYMVCSWVQCKGIPLILIHAAFRTDEYAVICITFRIKPITFYFITCLLVVEDELVNLAGFCYHRHQVNTAPRQEGVNHVLSPGIPKLYTYNI